MTPKSYSERKREEQVAAKNETVGIILTIVSAFVLLCLFTRNLVLGVIGSAISGFLLGFIGYFAYPLFLFLLVLGVLKIKNMSVTAGKKTILAIVLTVFCALLIAHFATSAKYMGNGYGSYLGSCFTGKDTVGGLSLGIVSYLFYALLKSVFSYVLLSVALVASIVWLVSLLANDKTIKRTASKTKTIKSTHYTIPTTNHTTSGGLFVGQIVKNETNYSSTEGSFDEMKEEEYTKPEYEPELTEDEYKRLRSREILFGQTSGFTYSPLPQKAVSAPDVRRQTPTPKSTMPEVPMPAPKNFEYNYVEGEIINGDAVSEASLKSGFIESKEETPIVQSQAPTYSTPAPEQKKEVSAYFNASPIINGDYYARDKVNSQFYVEQTAVESIGEEEETEESVQEQVESNFYAEESEQITEQVVENETASFSSYDYSYQEESYQEEEDEDNACEEFSAESEPIVSSVEETQTFERDDENEQSEEEIIDEEVIDELYDSEEIEDEQSEEDFAEEEQDDFDDEEIVEEEQDDFDAYEELTQEIFDDEYEPQADSETEMIDDEEKRAQELSARFDATTSFNIIDEVEDLSETGFSNDNDTTGYYSQIDIPVKPIEPVKPVVEEVKPVSFEERVDNIDRKINGASAKGQKPLAEQMDIDSFATDNARKQQESKVAEEKPKPVKKPKKYVAPPLDLLVTESTQPDTASEDTQANIDRLEVCLSDLGVPAKVNGVTVGPAITRYEMEMPPGMTVRRIENMADDIRYALASKGLVRIESPIPGKRAVGIEVPNATIFTVALKDIIGSPEFKASSSPLTIALGKDIQGKVMLTCLDKMPHLLIAGATGSGKSSCLNSLLISLMYKSSPADVRLILIDPKRVEFTAYNGLPHMLIENAITDVKKAIAAFKWACDEMERRYLVLQSNCVRDIREYNSMPAVKEGTLPKMHFIVIIVDELANLIMSSKLDKKTLEDAIVALASKARAAGIHLVLATQRPSVDVITGTIKANLPSRIAFAVSTMQDSRIILDGGGAETLLGRGDMLFAPLNESEETRIQGAFVENFEVKQIVDFVKENNSCDFDEEFCDAIEPKETSAGAGGKDDEGSQYDKELPEVVRCVIRSGKASSAHIQRRFRFGWNKAARIMEQMEELHFVGPQEGGAKSREIYITPEKFEEFFGEKFES